MLDFVQGDKVYRKYYDELIVLLETGLRIFEFCGLTISDLDFENRPINVDHQLLYSSGFGCYIEVPKTESGIKQIPMTENVYSALQNTLKNRRGAKPITIDSYRDFLFINRNGKPKLAVGYNIMFSGLVKKYNKCRKACIYWT